MNNLSDAQLDLYDRMSEISEDSFCGGWVGDPKFAPMAKWLAMVDAKRKPAEAPES
jgi:hypothetical protein